MNLSDPVKLVSQLLDLPILDKDDRWCGIVDDVEFTGGAGKEMRVKSLLVGPGAYAGRLPHWLYLVIEKVVGSHVARIPPAEIESIRSAVHLKCSAEEVGLHRTEDKVRSWIPRWGAM